MLPASAEYVAYEAQLHGARPAVRVSFLPYPWSNGVNVNGDFVECTFIAPDRIQADFHGFTGGYWISEELTAPLQVPTSSAVATWTWNSPGFDLVVYYRGANDSSALAAAAWTAISSGDTIQIYPCYQFKIALEGVRVWAEESFADAGDFTAWAEETAFASAYQGYAEEQNVPGDLLTYLEELEVIGEFTVVRDIEQAGSVSMEAPTAFDDLVAGSYSGLLLSNRQGIGEVTVITPGEEIDYAWTPQPLFSPNKSSFFMAGKDWYDLQLKIQLGWSKGGWFSSEWMEDEWMAENFTEFVTLFHGRVKSWGPVTRAVGSSNTVEVYAVDWIMDCLQKRIALPKEDGTPNPLTYGEFIVEAEQVAGWSPAPVVRSAYFETTPDYAELDEVVESGGGAVSIITPGLTGSTQAFRATTNGASQEAYGSIMLNAAGELFITGTLRFVSMPTSPSNLNLTFLQIIDEDGVSEDVYFRSDNTGYAVTNMGTAKINIKDNLNVPMTFALWHNPVVAGRGKFWINGSEIYNFYDNLSSLSPKEIRFGAITGGVAESWVIDFDDIEVRNTYYNYAYQVTGYPFNEISRVYIDDESFEDSQVVGDYTQTIVRYPEYGIVQFSSNEPDWDGISGDVKLRVVEKSGGRHALDIIVALCINGVANLASFSDFNTMITAWFACTKDLAGITAFLAAYGLTSYINVTSLAAAYTSCPNDIINARFEGGGERKARGLKDFSSMGIPIGDALKEITSRMLYWIFIDAGQIKIVPYTATSPASPVLALGAANSRENSQTIDLESVNAFVSAIYGWYDHNPALNYVAGDQSVGGQGTALDYTWNSPVVCEIRDVVKAKADLLLKFLSAKEVIDPVRMSLSGARLELMTDTVSLRDELLNDSAENYYVQAKEVGLDRGSRETTLTLVRFLGEI